MEEQGLELRMYFFVPYNISEIQKGIQAGHSALRFVLKYGRHDPDSIIWDFIEKYETFIILNGGTTNDKFNTVEEKPVGSLNQIALKLSINRIDHSVFREPDLNGALSAVCFVADERVWDFKQYPDWVSVNTEMPFSSESEDGTVTLGEPIETNQDGMTYEQWKEHIGGGKNLFLRELVHPKNAKLA